MYCTNCGKQIPNGSNFCTNCGSPVPGTQFNNFNQPVGQPQPYGQPYYGSNPYDKGGFWWGFLGFVLANITTFIVPLIMYFVWKDEYPKRAKSILKGMLISIIVPVALVALILLWYFLSFGFIWFTY